MIRLMLRKHHRALIETKFEENKDVNILEIIIIHLKCES